MFAYYNTDNHSVETYADIEHMLANVLAYCDYNDMTAFEFYRLHNFSEKDIFDCNYILHSVFFRNDTVFYNGESRFVTQSIYLKRNAIDMEKASSSIKTAFPSKQKNKFYAINDILFKTVTEKIISEANAQFILELTYVEFDCKEEDAVRISTKASREILINQLLKDL